MKYIRTKEEMDKIHEVAWINCGYIGFLDTKNGCDISHIYKESDTIEELCDVFICQQMIFRKLKDVETYLRSANEWCNFAIYGAIWTDKGLIYVAKMNDEGELELL